MANGRPHFELLLDQQHQNKQLKKGSNEIL